MVAGFSIFPLDRVWGPFFSLSQLGLLFLVSVGGDKTFGRMKEAGQIVSAESRLWNIGEVGQQDYLT